MIYISTTDISVNMRLLTWMLRAGLTMAVAGLTWMVWPSQTVDRSYAPLLEHPAFAAGARPRVVVDEGHLNAHTSSGGYRAFARLLQRDGFRVMSSEGRITAAALRGADIFVTVNPLGYIGLAQHLANLAHLERAVRLNADAFDADEAQRVAEWVAAGGRALIVADHAPAGLAARRLALSFGVEMTNWWAEDRSRSDITFTRSNGGVREHPITIGRTSAERVNAVMTFTGQALKPPPGASVLLQFSASAREYPFRRSRDEEGRSVAGLAQAVALPYGRGRVVVLGEAAALTAQRIGMNRRDVDNQQFALNIVHWLMGLIG
jgi:hypothetical protein